MISPTSIQCINLALSQSTYIVNAHLFVILEQSDHYYGDIAFKMICDIGLTIIGYNSSKVLIII